MVKQAKAKLKKTSATGGRVRPLSKKQARQKAKKEAEKQAPVAGSFKLLKQSFLVFKHNWKVLSGVVLVYLIVNIIFAGGLLGDLNGAISTARQSSNFSNALGGYGSLLTLGSTSGNAQGASSGAQTILLVLESLVIIWALRQLIAGQKITVKEVYYRSMAPLVPFLLVLLVILLQLLPMTLGAVLLGTVLSSAVTASALVTVIFSVGFILLSIWSIYMTSASIFGLYIVTLPDMQPRQALRSAKNLVRYRRWMLLRKLFFLPLFILLALGVISVPLIVFIPFVVAPVFFILLMITILFVHTYLYNLYRGLIG